MKTGLSIITVSSAVDFDLQKTLHSVNTLPKIINNKINFEYLVVIASGADLVDDLASKILRKDLLPKVNVLKDDGVGIYQAMNIGLRASQYQFTYFLNAGDQLYNSELWERLFSILDSNRFNESGNSITFQTYQKYSNDLFLRGKNIRQLTEKTLIAHQGIIFNKKSFSDNSFEVESNNYWSDSLFIKRNVENILPLLEVGAIFELGGISNSPRTQFGKRPKHKLLQHLIKIFISRLVSDKYYYRVIFFFKYKRVNVTKRPK